MKRAVLKELVSVQGRGEPAVLVRSLTSGRQLIVDRRGARGDFDEIPEALRQAAEGALYRDGAKTMEIAGERYLVQTLSVPAKLIIVGAVHIAQILIPMGRMAGFQVRLIDPRTAFASPQRFPDVDIDNDWPHEVMPGLALDGRTAVVTLSHDAKIDEPALEAALKSDAFYIGALGSKKNHSKRLERLARLGFDDATLARIHGPIGLPLGGRSPAEIAVAILAQIIQARYAR